MEKFNFDEVINRIGSCSFKWDKAPDGVLPMWVADMDFRTAPAIIKALQKRLEHGVFGYNIVPDEYYAAVINWFKRRHGVEYKKEWIICTTGVMPAISAIIKAFTVPGDKIVLQTPVYNCFFSTITNNGCEVLPNKLIAEGDSYYMDFDDLEAKVADERAKILILSNPHNPAGRVWKKQELERLGEICMRHNVLVVADEIHCEFVYSGYKYIPFASISKEFMQKSVTCISPSKAFNIAGLQIANVIAADNYVRKAISSAIEANEVGEVNSFGIPAAIAAYNESEDWLMQLVEYLECNYKFMKDFCSRELPDFPLAVLEGTYLVWMDCRKLGMSSHALGERLISEARLWLNEGSKYGVDGDGFMRWNIACPKSILEDGLKRFRDWVRG